MTASADGERAVDRANDRWSGEARSDEYDPYRFYPRATDGHGHSDRLTIKFPPDIVQQASALIATQTWPVYTNVHDLVRDSLVHRLAWISEHPAEGATPDSNVVASLRSMLQNLILQNTLDAYEAELVAADRVKAKLRRVCAIAIQEGDHEALRAFLDTIRQHVDGFRHELATPIYNLIDEYYEKIP